MSTTPNNTWRCVYLPLVITAFAIVLFHLWTGVGLEAWYKAMLSWPIVGFIYRRTWELFTGVGFFTTSQEHLEK